MTPSAVARFEAARQHAAVPGSRLLMQWLRDRGGLERAGLRDAPRAAYVTGADSAVVTQWGGMDWSDWARGAPLAVTEATARTVSAVVACCNLIGGSIACLPLHFYRRKVDGERERVTGGQVSDLWWLFNERPHHEWSAAAFWNFVSDSRLLHGDAFVRIHRGGDGKALPVAFEPWHPSMVDVDRKDGGLLYTFWSKDGRGRPQTVQADDVLHFTGPGFDGVRSMSQLRHGLLYPVGIASAADEQAATVMADGARPDFAIEVSGNLDQGQRDDLRAKWLARHTGPGAKRAPVILANGMKLHQLTMSMEDAQLLTTRAFQVEEVCRIFGVPPHMVGHTDKTTSWGAGIEQQSMGFVTYTLARHLNAFEQEINHKLFKTPRNFCEFVTAGLLRGDTKSRFEAYRIALGRAGEPAWMKPSEVRALENMQPEPTLDNQPAQPAPQQGATS